MRTARWIPGVALALTVTTAPLAGRQVDRSAWPVRNAPSLPIDVVHYRIALRFDESTRSLFGQATVTLTTRRDDVRDIVLDAETFRVDSVHLKGVGAVPFTQGDGELRIRLPRPMGRSDTTAVTVTYVGRNVDVDPEAFGMSAEYDLGLDFKPATDDHPRLINTLSFPTGARHWFPAVDHPADKATADIVATVRDGYRVLSNGRLVSVTHTPEDGTVTYHWAQEQPHSTYLFVLVAGPYVILEDSLGSLPINYWVYERDALDAPRSFRRTPDIIAFFNEQFGYRYPWAKYDQVTIPGIGGGAESTTATVLGESTIHDARADQDFPSHWLVAHEAAHQWWGDLVTMRRWADAWINEGFATYWEYRWAAADLGADEAVVNMQQKRDAYFAEARTRYIRPIVSTRWRVPNDNFDRHIYQKAAAVLHMLHDVIGDDAFRAVHAAFLTRYAFDVADTDDLIAVIEEVTGEKIRWFFDQWVFAPGHPVLDVSWEWDGEVARVRIRQVQDTTGGVPVFVLPLDIAVEAGGRREVRRVRLTRADEVVDLPAAARPDLVRVDARNVLLAEWRFPKSNPELVYQLEHDDVAGRMWAAGQLAERDQPAPVAAALIRAAGEDGFWAVRRAAVDALARTPQTRRVAVFQRAALDDHPQVRVAGVRALGDIGDAGFLGFLAGRFPRENSYLVQAAIVRAVGRIGDAAGRPVLEAALEMDSPSDVVRRAAREVVERRR